MSVLNSPNRSFVASAAVEGYRIVKPDGSGGVVKAAAATDLLLGTSATKEDCAIGGVLNLALGPLPQVRLGGTLLAGEPITSDANAKGIKATATGHRYIGFAEVGGVADDVITYIRAPGVL